MKRIIKSFTTCFRILLLIQFIQVPIRVLYHYLAIKSWSRLTVTVVYGKQSIIYLFKLLTIRHGPSYKIYQLLVINVNWTSFYTSLRYISFCILVYLVFFSFFILIPCSDLTFFYVYLRDANTNIIPNFLNLNLQCKITNKYDRLIFLTYNCEI